MDQAKWTGYFKIVQPQPDTVKVTDNMSLDASAYNNYSWYQRLVHGSSSRISRYQEYDVMDQDVDVARALDLVAEEMTNKNGKTNLPLDVELQVEDGREIPNNLIATIRVALKHWCIKNNFDTRLFKIARNVIKYGDLVFRKEKDIGKKWEYINNKHVIAAVVDAEDIHKVVAYQIRSDIKKPRQNVGGAVPVHQEYETEIVAAEDIIFFSLNDDMSEEAPFGESVLSTVYRVQKQKELLEDAIVIYRVQRAPERRVFYIDVGKMPPQRTKQYLEQIKNEIRQKKVPSTNGGHANMDSTYNPQSMSEDFYFAQRPGGGGSRVETLPGGQNLGELTDLEYFRSKVLEGLRIPPSYLPNFETQELSGQFSDGAAGTSYMQEVQFFKYVMRLQTYVNDMLDLEFKKFMQKLGIKIDETMYKIKLPLPTNFEKYKQAAIDSELLNQFSSADGVEYLSKRFILSRYLRLTPEEMATNEMMIRQERGLDPYDGQALVKIYNPDMMGVGDTGDDLGGMGGGGGGLGGGLDDIGGDDLDQDDQADEDLANSEDNSNDAVTDDDSK